MTGVIGAVTAFAVLLAIVLVLAVRPPARRFARTTAAVRADLAVRLDRLRALRRARPTRAPLVEPSSVLSDPVLSDPVLSDPVLSDPGPSDGATAAAAPSAVGRPGRHRRSDGAP